MSDTHEDLIDRANKMNEVNFDTLKNEFNKIAENCNIEDSDIVWNTYDLATRYIDFVINDYYELLQDIRASLTHAVQNPDRALELLHAMWEKY